MNFLIATNNATFLKEATSIIGQELPKINHIQDVIKQSEILKKIAKEKFSYILIDLNSCSIDSAFIAKLSKLKNIKIKITCQHHADIPVELLNQKSIQIMSTNLSFLDQELKKFLLNDKDFFWGEEICELQLYKTEILCHEGSAGNAIYLIKNGSLQREFPNGSILDGSIGAGKMVGELAYFTHEPRKWKVIAVEDCTLVRISYLKVNKQLKNQPGWVKVMFTSLAERSLKYAKAS